MNIDKKTLGILIRKAQEKTDIRKQNPEISQEDYLKIGDELGIPAEDLQAALEEWKKQEDQPSQSKVLTDDTKNTQHWRFFEAVGLWIMGTGILLCCLMLLMWLLKIDLGSDYGFMSLIYALAMAATSLFFYEFFERRKQRLQGYLTVATCSATALICFFVTDNSGWSALDIGSGLLLYGGVISGFGWVLSIFAGLFVGRLAFKKGLGKTTSILITAVFSLLPLLLLLQMGQLIYSGIVFLKMVSVTIVTTCYIQWWTFLSEVKLKSVISQRIAGGFALTVLFLTIYTTLIIEPRRLIGHLNDSGYSNYQMWYQKDQLLIYFPDDRRLYRLDNQDKLTQTVKSFKNFDYRQAEYRVNDDNQLFHITRIENKQKQDSIIINSDRKWQLNAPELYPYIADYSLSQNTQWVVVAWKQMDSNGDTVKLLLQIGDVEKQTILWQKEMPGFDITNLLILNKNKVWLNQRHGDSWLVSDIDSNKGTLTQYGLQKQTLFDDGSLIALMWDDILLMNLLKNEVIWSKNLGHQLNQANRHKQSIVVSGYYSTTILNSENGKIIYQAVDPSGIKGASISPSGHLLTIDNHGRLWLWSHRLNYYW
ncbi:MAG: hypothetical protein HON94_05380 [Methylococcales bacterium]|jgi:hypothetical protein|nr:hypothetical protein [Methylococcales bacterium]MBT7409008.1 hypothetical protein [Methylococcales bacterium]